MTGENRPIDDDARRRIAFEHEANLFVQAGAGSGKTTQMVQRIAELVSAGVELQGIVAITFTEKAAAELRQRVREELEKRSAEAPSGTSADFTRALDQLDSAAIGTIHAYARRLLDEFPIEARVPPRFEVRSELASTIANEKLWRSQRSAFFRDESIRPSVELLIDAGATLDTFEKISTQCDQHWDQVEEMANVRWPLGALERYLDLIKELVALAPGCLKPEKDSLYQRINEYSEIHKLWSEVEPADIPKVMALLRQAPSIHNRTGAKTNWPIEELERGREIGRELETQARVVVQELTGPAISVLLSRFARTAVERAEERRRQGTLDFQDLLVFARDLLLSNRETWLRVANRYPLIIVDEFQDTDPLQAEIVSRIAATDFLPETSWEKQPLRPGALVTVGDPKQSVYRFRGADIDTYFRHKDREKAMDESVQVELTTNFRSSRPVLDWINQVFEHIIVGQPGIQPTFTPLAAGPAAPGAEALDGPAVTVIGSGVKEGDAATARANESRDIAQSILTAVGEGPAQPAWTKQVRRGNGPSTEPVTLGDICILIPSRTSLPPLESALREAGIEFISEASSVVYSTMEVQALLFAARAIAYPVDEAAVVLALRSPMFGFGDDELFEWKQSGGSWSLFDKRVEPGGPSPVATALYSLQKLAYALPAMTPSDVLESLVADCLLMEKGLFAGTGRRAWWRRVRYVVDQAEAWYQATAGSMRDYLAWAEIQQDESTRVREAVAPDLGMSAVHIMTVHMAKGLEFPVVMLAGAMSGPKVNRPAVIWNQAGGPQVLFAGSDNDKFPVSTPGYQDCFDVEREATEAEFRRLFYVACTRAESHLVISRHRHKGSIERCFGSYVDGVVSQEGIEGWVQLEPWEKLPTMESAEAMEEANTAVDDDDWFAWHQEIVSGSSRMRSLSVTTLAHEAQSQDNVLFMQQLGLAVPPDASVEPVPLPSPQGSSGQKKGPVFRPKAEVDAERTARIQRDAPEVASGQNGVGGAAFGVALHWLMEAADLTPTDSLADLARQVASERGLRNPDSLEQSARAAMDHPLIQRARVRPHWLELPLATAITGTVLEGVADLVYQEDNGSLVVVDFKTDRQLSDESAQAYWIQLSAYARIIARATGRSTDRCVILHVPPGSTEAKVLEHEVVAVAG